MLQILREFSADPILSIYVIDDVWEYMKAMKVCYNSETWKHVLALIKRKVDLPNNASWLAPTYVLTCSWDVAKFLLELRLDGIWDHALVS